MPHINRSRALALTCALCVAICIVGIGLWRGLHPPVSYRLTQWPLGGQPRSFSLLDTNGHARSLADYRGRTVILFFGFLRCPNACPAELFKLSVVMKQLGPSRDNVQVLFVTLDPERDTPQLLRDYVTAFDPAFVGLTGTPAQIASAARSFLVAYAKVPHDQDYTIDHSTTTYILDKNARLRLLGAMDTTVQDYAHDLALLAAE